MKSLILTATILLISSTVYASVPVDPISIVVSVKDARIVYEVDGKNLEEDAVYDYLKTQFYRFGVRCPVRVVATKETPLSEPIKLHHSIKALGFLGDIEFYVAYPAITMTTYFGREIIDWKCLYKFQIDANPPSN